MVYVFHYVFEHLNDNLHSKGFESIKLLHISHVNRLKSVSVEKFPSQTVNLKNK